VYEVAAFLKQPFYRSPGSSQQHGNFLVIATLQTPAHDLPVRRRKAFNGFVQYHLGQRFIGLRIGWLGAGAEALALWIAPLRPVKDAARANFLNRHDDQERPEFPIFRDVVETLARFAEERSEHRLNDVIGIEPAFQVVPDFLAGNRADALNVPLIQFLRGTLVAGAIALQKQLIRVGFEAPWGASSLESYVHLHLPV
jgi:hypothetical protein